MVKPIIFLMVLFPFLVIGGEFTASVSQTQLAVGEAFSINLTLKDATAKGVPIIESLKKDFNISSQQHSSNISILNGKVSSTNIWKLILIPLKEGDFIISPIEIKTDTGILSTQPLAIKVGKVGPKATSEESSETNELNISTDISNPNPYKNEPVIFTVKLNAKSNLANVQIQKIELENAIIEANGEPKIYEKLGNGRKEGVIEFSYLVTPLKTGSLKIPSLVIQGGILTARIKKGYFDDDTDFFSMLHGLERLKPFAIASKETILDIKSPVAEVSPWLPAQSLELEEIWDERQIPQVGEPLNRTLKIIASGTKSSHLPNLSSEYSQEKTFKIYTDKPEVSEQIINGVIKSTRKEQYTIIPQRPGDLTLPEINVCWWDTLHNEKVNISIPPRTLNVLPPAITQIENTNQIVSLNDPLQPTIIDSSQDKSSTNVSISNIAILILAILLLTAIFWGVFLQRKIKLLNSKEEILTNDSDRASLITTVSFADAETTKPKKREKEKLPDLNPT